MTIKCDFANSNIVKYEFSMRHFSTEKSRWRLSAQFGYVGAWQDTVFRVLLFRF